MSDYLQNRLNQKLYGKPEKEKKVYKIPKVSQKRAAEIEAEKTARGNDDTELQKFFKRCMKQMIGICAETGAKLETKNYEFAIRSIAHILPKSTCPSVAYHPCNWIELAPDVHYRFDNYLSWEDKKEMKCWPQIEAKLQMIYPDLAQEERKYFPDFIITEYPF